MVRILFLCAAVASWADIAWAIPGRARQETRVIGCKDFLSNPEAALQGNLPPIRIPEPIARFRLFPMRSRFHGESEGRVIEVPVRGESGETEFQDQFFRVTYLSAAERLRYRLHFARASNGEVILLDSSGALFDTSDGGPYRGNAGRVIESRGAAIYVMDGFGNFYAHLRPVQGEFHHSSFLSGGPVAGAGEMIVLQGRLIRLSDYSGHYRLASRALDQVSEELRFRLETDAFRVEHFDDAEEFIRRTQMPGMGWSD